MGLKLFDYLMQLSNVGTSREYGQPFTYTVKLKIAPQIMEQLVSDEGIRCARITGREHCGELQLVFRDDDLQRQKPSESRI